MSILEKAKTYVGVYSETDIRSKLKSDHDAIREFAKGACEEQTTAKRSESFKQLKALLTAHARAEEAVVYNALIKMRGSPDSRDYGNEGFVEHGIVDTLMEQITATRPAGSDLWNARAKVLHELLKHHIDEEEKNVFEELGEHFDEDRLVRMADDFESRKSQLMAGARGLAQIMSSTSSGGGRSTTSSARGSGRSSSSGSGTSKGSGSRGGTSRRTGSTAGH